MNLLDLAIDAAATTRITRLVADDEIARPAREWVEFKTGQDSQLTYLINCPYCVSVWAGLVVSVAPRWAKVPLALSALAIGSRIIGDRIKS